MGWITVEYIPVESMQPLKSVPNGQLRDSVFDRVMTACGGLIRPST